MAFEDPDYGKVFSGHRSVFTLSRDESRPDFFSGLMDTITGKGAPSDDDDFRLSASIHLEETIMLCWENSLFISDYEKTNLRNKLLSHLQEENDQIAHMLGIIISKIAIFDYPCQWPELFSVLAMRLKEGEGNALTSQRILEVLSCTIQLLVKDTSDEGTSFAKISSQLFDSCLKLWHKDAIIVFEYLKHQPLVVPELELDLTFERWLLCLSVVQKLLNLGFQGYAKSGKALPVKSVCIAFIKTVELLLKFDCTDRPKLLLNLKICVNLMKCLVEIQNLYSTFFYNEAVLELCLKIIVEPRFSNLPLYEQLLIECMVMVKSVLKRTSNNTFSPGLRSEDVTKLCEILITRYFLLTKDDLKKWSQDPESFYHETNPCNELDRFAEKLRPHAEALFDVVFESYGEHLRPVVCSLLSKATEDRPANEEDSLEKRLRREAAYTAVARVCPRFFGEFELVFKKLFEGVLCPELRVDHLNMRVIHRKIAFIVQKWAYEAKADMSKRVFRDFCELLKYNDLAVRAKADMSKPVFRDLCELLKYNDLAVRLAACQPLEYLSAKIDFQEEDSVDLFHSYWDLCLKLLVDVQDLRSKKLVLDCVLSGLLKIGENIKEKLIIVKIGEKITPFVGKLVNEIDKARIMSTGYMTLQIIVLRALHFLNELGIHSPVSYKILEPVLAEADASNRLDLLMYGMQLWESTLSHAPSMDAQLLKLFRYVQLVVRKSFDYFPHKINHINDRLKVASEITSGYIKLGGETFYPVHASVINELFDEFYKNLNAVRKQFTVGRLRNRNMVVFDFVASVKARVSGLNTDKIDLWLNIDNIDPDYGRERANGESMPSFKKQKLSAQFPSFEGELNLGKMKDTEIPVEQ